VQFHFLKTWVIHPCIIYLKKILIWNYFQN